MENRQIKIVIWDLDNTFWDGTLSEETVKEIPENIELVKYLTSRGIMNSICSKNDYNKAKKILVDFGIFDFFVFPHISWFPKGEQIKELLNQCSLRAVNALFLDDNVSNRKEVEFYNPGIATRDIISLSTVREDPAFEGKNDFNHSRLANYKLLEKKQNDKKQHSNNITFLKQSKINISLNEDCINHVDRLYELITRTNQLNYTKNRPSFDDFINSLQRNESYYITASDRHDDYGIVGFVQIDMKENALHFLFSCRVLGMNIDSFVWQILGRPNVSIVGDISSHLLDDEINYIACCKEVKKKESGSIFNKNKKILIVGGCDLEQTFFYLKQSRGYFIDTEFNKIVNGYDIRASDLCNILYSSSLPEYVKDEMCDNICFYYKSITFGTNMFTGKYDTIILSVVDDYIRGFYQSKSKGNLVALFGYWKDDQVFWRSKCDKRTIDYLDNNYVFVGRQSENRFKENLLEVIDKIPNSTQILLLNGCEIDVSETIGKDRVERNEKMNRVVDEVCSIREMFL